MKIDKLTPEQESKFGVYVDKYTHIFFNNPKIANYEEVRDYMHWFYNKFILTDDKVKETDLEMPEVILVDSPLGILKVIDNIEQIFDKKNTDLMDKFDSVDRTSPTCNEDLIRVLSEIETGEKKKLKFHEPSYYLSAFNSWISFYDFFDKECFTLDDSEVFNLYKRVLDLNIFWSVAFDNYVIVSRNAIKFKRDELFRLHSFEESAIEFLDGYQLYFIHGIGIKEEIWVKLQDKTFSFSDFSKLDNQEVKYAILEFMTNRWGNDYTTSFLSKNLKEVDTYVDKKSDQYLIGTTGGMNIGVYTLLKGSIGDLKLAYVRCYCPSTDRMFFLDVHPDNMNAKDAIASLYRIPSKLVSEIKAIQRQGERFSTILTSTGKSIQEKMTKEDFGDLVNINGDKYFSLITYEY